MRHAVRRLLAAPSFTLGAVACLSLGLAGTIAGFSLINAALFRSMPGVRDQPALRTVWLGAGSRHGPMVRGASDEDFEAFRGALAPVADLAAFTRLAVSLQHDGDAVAARAVFVSPDYFRVLGTEAAIGRVLAPNDEDAALVSHRFWRDQMAARPDAIGGVIRINGRPVPVVGIAPALYAGAERGEVEDDPERVAAVWLPLALRAAIAGAESGGEQLSMFARPRAGVRGAELQARANATAAGLAAADPSRLPGAFTYVRPLHRGPYEEPIETALALLTLMSVPLGILAIACANVANLLLARAAAHRREIGVRLALGASPVRIVRELLTEAMLLAVSASAVALGLCWMAIRASAAWSPFPVAIDWRVALFAIGAAAATAVGFGLLPALASSRVPLTLRLHDLRAVRPRARRVLVAGQIALSVALLVIASLMTRTMMQVTTAARQPDEDRVVTMTFKPALARLDAARADAFGRALAGRAQALPGVAASGISNERPFRWEYSLAVRQPGEGADRRRAVAGGHVSEGFLTAAGLEVVAGRVFTAAEHQSQPSVVLVNETLAAVLGEAGVPGRSILAGDLGVPIAERVEVELQIAGIVRDDPRQPAGRAAPPTAYVPSPIAPTAAPRPRTLWVRARQSDSGRLIADLRAIATQLEAAIPVTDAMTIAHAREREAGPYRLLARGMTAAGLLGVVLAGLGLYALLSYVISQNARELGIRLALGARARHIVGLLVAESAWLAAWGVLAGGAIAASVALSLRNMFHGIGPLDPVSFAAAGSVLAVVALLAAARPAVRAARTDPASVLRAE